MKKKVLGLVLMGLLAFGTQIGKGQIIGRNCPSSDTGAGKIKLTTRILDNSEIKTGDDEISGVKLKLKLIFSSECEKVLLIYKGAPAVTHYWISKNVESAESGINLISSNLTVLTENEKQVGGLSMDDFAVVSNKKAFETEEEVRILFKKEILKKGSYVLQIKVKTWGWDEEDAEKTRIRLLTQGSILTDSIISEPMIINIDE